MIRLNENDIYQRLANVPNYYAHFVNNEASSIDALSLELYAFYLIKELNDYYKDLYRYQLDDIDISSITFISESKFTKKETIMDVIRSFITSNEFCIYYENGTLRIRINEKMDMTLNECRKLLVDFYNKAIFDNVLELGNLNIDFTKKDFRSKLVDLKYSILGKENSLGYTESMKIEKDIESNGVSSAFILDFIIKDSLPNGFTKKERILYLLDVLDMLIDNPNITKKELDGILNNKINYLGMNEDNYKLSYYNSSKKNNIMLLNSVYLKYALNYNQVKDGDLISKALNTGTWIIDVNGQYKFYTSNSKIAKDYDRLTESFTYLDNIPFIKLEGTIIKFEYNEEIYIFDLEKNIFYKENKEKEEILNNELLSYFFKLINSLDFVKRDNINIPGIIDKYIAHLRYISGEINTEEQANRR